MTTYDYLTAPLKWLIIVKQQCKHPAQQVQHYNLLPVYQQSYSEGKNLKKPRWYKSIDVFNLFTPH